MHVIKAIAWKCTGVKLFVMHLSCEDQEEDWVLCVKPRPRASLLKIVSRVSITSDIPDSPRAPFQVHSPGRCGDAYSHEALVSVKWKWQHAEARIAQLPHLNPVMALTRPQEVIQSGS